MNEWMNKAKSILWIKKKERAKKKGMNKWMNEWIKH